MPSWLDEVGRRVEELPSWARPPFYGMFLVYGMAAGRALFVLPVLIIAVIAGGPEGILQALWILIVAGLAGFAGGVAFAVAHPLLRRLGKVGALATGWLSVFAYLVVVVPALRSDDPHFRYHFDPHHRVAWASMAVAAVIFGSVLGAGFFPEANGEPRRLRRWVQRQQRVTSRVHPPAT